jgi:hypothetical protein
MTREGRPRCVVVAVALLALAAASCTTASPSSTPDAALVAIRTLAPPGPNDICLLARGGGILVVDPVSGLGVADTTGRVTHVYWPFGYTARREGDTIALLDRGGRVVAQLGDVIGMTGGYGSNDEWAACQSEPVTILATARPR